MDDQEFMASVMSDMSDEELEAFCDALCYDLSLNLKSKQNKKEERKDAK